MSARFVLFFFFNDTATTEIYTLSLHDALPISLDLGTRRQDQFRAGHYPPRNVGGERAPSPPTLRHQLEARQTLDRSEEHTSELQSHLNLVCRLLLEKKKNTSTARPQCVDPLAD